MNVVHLSGVPPGRQARAWPGKENNMIVTPTAPSSEGTVVMLSGGLDLAAAPALREQLIDVLHHRTGLLILDLSRVLSCDTAGLAVLIGTQRVSTPWSALLAAVATRVDRRGDPFTAVHRSAGRRRDPGGW
jgi:anti-anti-sigma factor